VSPPQPRKHLPSTDARRTLDAIADVVLVADEAGTIVYANRATYDVLGWPPIDLYGSEVVDLVPERLRERHRNGLRRYAERGQLALRGATIRSHAVRRDGREIPVDLVLTHLASEEHEPLVLCLLRPHPADVIVEAH